MLQVFYSGVKGDAISAMPVIVLIEMMHNK